MDSSKTRLELFEQEQDGPRFFGQPGNVIVRPVLPQPDLPGASTASSTLSTNISRSSTIESYASSSSRSVVSSPTSIYGSVLSRRDTSSSISTVPDLGPPEDELDPQHSNTAMDYNGPDYRCVFPFMNCRVRFAAYDFENWYNHSLSHFEQRPLPVYTRCIFCDDTFENDDTEYCWRLRMSHIAEHLDAGRVVERDERPDFALIKHMYSVGIISPVLLEALKKGNERPHLQGLRSHDYVPESIKKEQEAQNERDNRIIVKESRRSKQDGHLRSSTRRRR